MPIVGRFGSLAGLGSLILPGGAMESIATVTVGSGGASEILFSDIAGTYQHLQIRLIGRSAASATSDNVRVRVNGDSGANYSDHKLEGNGSAASSYGYASQTNFTANRIAAANATSSIFGAVVIDILDYASTSKNTTFRSLGGVDLNGSGFIFLDSGAWYNTSAVTSVRLAPNATNWAQHTTAALYGLRAP
jgi:hypothetical protein